MNTSRVICIIGCIAGMSSQSPAGDLQFIQATSGINARLNGVTVGGESFVAIGTNSTVLSSTIGPAGLTWNASTVPTNGLNLWAVTYGGGLFVAGGSSNLVFSSADGRTWLFRSYAFSPFKRDVRGLAFTDATATYVSVAEGPDIRWTDSLAAWSFSTITNLGAIEVFRGVTPFGTDGLAACGVRGVIRISRDAGRTWSANRVYSPSEPDLLGIAYGGGMLVCVGTGGRIMVSPDLGTNWTVSTVGSDNLNAVAYTGSEFIVVGNNGVIRHSADASQWPLVTYSGQVSNLLGVACATQGALQGATVIVGEGGTVLV
jgi:hypothetical protein